MYTFAHNIRIYEGLDNKIQANLQSQVISVDSHCFCQDVGSAMPLWFFYVLLDPPGNLQSASQWSQPLSGRTGEKVSGGFGSRSQRSLHRGWPGGSVALGHLGCWKCSTQWKIWQRSHFMRSRTTDRCHFGREVFQLDRGKIHSASQHQFHWEMFSESSLDFQRFLYINHSRAKESSSLFQMMADEDGQVSYSRFMDGMNRAKGLAKAAACLVRRSVRNWGRLF